MIEHGAHLVHFAANLDIANHFFALDDRKSDVVMLLAGLRVRLNVA